MFGRNCETLAFQNVERTRVKLGTDEDLSTSCRIAIAAGKIGGFAQYGKVHVLGIANESMDRLAAMNPDSD